MLFQNYLLNYLIVNEITIITEFYKYKNVQSVLIFHCFDVSTTSQILKIFSENGMRICSTRVDESINPIIYKDTSKLGIVVNSSCKGWLNIFDHLDAKTFKRPFVWLILSENLTETIDSMSIYSVELDSDVTIIVKQGNNSIFYEVYNTGSYRYGQLIVKEIGVWNKSVHIEVKYRKDLEGLVLKTAVVILLSQRVANKTFVRYLDEEQPDLVKVDPVHKFKGYAVLKYFQDMFNISYDFKRTKSWGYGSNGTFDGLVGALQRQEADVGGSPLFLRADRMHAVDYVAEAWLTKPNFIFRHPKHLGGFHTIYTRPLDDSVWWCVISFLVLSTFVLGLLFHFRTRRPLEISESGGDMSFSFAFLFIWSAICQQGMTIKQSYINENGNGNNIYFWNKFISILQCDGGVHASARTTQKYKDPERPFEKQSQSRCRRYFVQ